MLDWKPINVPTRVKLFPEAEPVIWQLEIYRIEFEAFDTTDPKYCWLDMLNE